MTLTSDIFNGVDPSVFSEIRYEDYDNKELRIMVKLADNPNLNRPGEIRAWFFWDDGHVLWNKKAEPKYKVNGGDVFGFRRFYARGQKRPFLDDLPVGQVNGTPTRGKLTVRMTMRKMQEIL